MRSILLGLAVACAAAAQAGGAGDRGDQTRRFELDVPPHAGSRPTYLVIRDLTVPRNASIVIRAYAVGPDSGRVLLGSTTVPGVAPDAEGVSVLPQVRISATRGLRQWLAATPARRRVSVELAVVTPQDSTRSVEPWSVRALELVNPH